MYWSYPSVDSADRLEHAVSIDPARVRLSPHEAAESAGVPLPAPVALNTFDGRPVYRFASRGDTVVYADTGERQRIDDAVLARVAAAWIGLAVERATVETLVDVDQWTIQVFRTSAPLRKFSWPSGEHVYVSERSGEVVQATTRASRVGAYLGPIPHWLYVTPIRKHPRVWSAVVIGASAAGTLTALIGLLIGLSKYSPSRRFSVDGMPSCLPYREQKRWHVTLGLIFGVAAVTWCFSGMLSMDPFPIQRSDATSQRGAAIAALSQSLAIGPNGFGRQHPGDALRSLAAFDVRQLEWYSFAGEPMYLATLAGGDTRIIRADGVPATEIGVSRLAEAVSRAAGLEERADLQVLEQYRLVLSRSTPRAPLTRRPREAPRQIALALLPRPEDRPDRRQLRPTRSIQPLGLPCSPFP